MVSVCDAFRRNGGELDGKRRRIMLPFDIWLFAFDEHDIVDIDLLGDVFDDDHEWEGRFFRRRLEDVSLSFPFIVSGADHLAMAPILSAAEPCGVVIGGADLHGDGIEGGRFDWNVAKMAEPSIDVRAEACFVRETDGVFAVRSIAFDDFKRGVCVTFVPNPVLWTDGGKRFK